MNSSRVRACESIVSVLKKSLPFVKVGDDEGAIHLAYRRRGEVIDDPDCEVVYEALEDGVFKRFDMYRGQQHSFKWMRLGPADADFLASALDADFDQMSDLDVEAIPAGLAFSVYKREEAIKRNVRSDISEEPELPSLRM